MAIKRSSSSSASISSIWPFLHEISEVDLLLLQPLDILLANEGLAFLKHNKRPPGSSPVGMNDHIVVEFLMRDINLGGECSLPPHRPYLCDETLWIIDQADQGTVNKHA